MYSVYDDRIAPAGFLHSEIHGSMPICGSPWLIAAYHVFRRLPVPRHSPCALFSLTMLYRTHFVVCAQSFENLRCYFGCIVVCYPIILLIWLYYLTFSQFLSLFNFQGAFTTSGLLWVYKLFSCSFSLGWVFPFRAFPLVGNSLESLSLSRLIWPSAIEAAPGLFDSSEFSLGGHKWTRTTDLALIRRAL